MTPPDTFWIPGPWRGRLAVIARPRGGDWLAGEVSGWRQAGFDMVISLLEADEAAQLELRDESALAEDEGIRFVSFPIPDRGIPASISDALLLMNSVSAVLEEGKNVAMHCRQGIGRSGLMAAGVLATSGVHPSEALRTVSAARGVPTPETAEQREWVLRLASRLPIATR